MTSWLSWECLASNFSPLINQISSFFFFFSYRNQAMRKKLILYFKRRNHARKQWVSDSCVPRFMSLKQRNSLCQKGKGFFQQRPAEHFVCCFVFFLAVASLMLTATRM